MTEPHRSRSAQGSLAFALHLADVADEISMRHFRRDPASRTKADGTIVTEADEEVETALRSEIRDAYPGHAIFGEEGGRSGDGTDRWILDPIDGTINFAAGIQVWATLIAFESAGEVLAGVVSAPALAERYEAARGCGSQLNGEAIRVSSRERIEDARLAYTSVRSFRRHGRGEAFDHLERAVKWARGFSDFWGHALVARGSVDIMAEAVINPWDIAPLIVIVEEAGGRMTDLQGRRGIDHGSVLSTNGVLHDAALAAFDRR